MILFLVLPLLALIWRTELAEIGTHLAQEVARRAILLSVWTSATATLLTVLLGTPLALLIARRRFPGRRALDTVIDLPTVLPPAVAGLALLMAFGRRGMIGQSLSIAGIEIAFTSLAVILAQIFVASPYYIRAAIGGLSRSAAELEEAAALDGGRQSADLPFCDGPTGPRFVAGRTGYDLGQGVGRFRRDYPFRRQLSGAHTDHAPGHLYWLRDGT